MSPSFTRRLAIGAAVEDTVPNPVGLRYPVEIRGDRKITGFNLANTCIDVRRPVGNRFSETENSAASTRLNRSNLAVGIFQEDVVDTFLKIEGAVFGEGSRSYLPGLHATASEGDIHLRPATEGLAFLD